MKQRYFVHQFEDSEFKLSVYKENIFYFLKIELNQYGIKLLSTPKIPIAKPVLEELINVLRHGTQYTNTANFSFIDQARSYIVLYNGCSSLLGRVANQLTNTHYNFDVKGIDREALAIYLMSENYF